MALPDSSLYLACKSVQDAISVGLQANSHGIKIYMGAPADIATRNTETKLNLFFYRFEPSGFQAGTHPNDPWRIRVFCLMTCISADGDTQGVEDLRLMGMLMSYLHENRVMPLITINDESVRLQAIFSPVSDEQINQIWSTQGETTYRPSVIYEIALAPVMPEVNRGKAPKVGYTGVQSFASMQHKHTEFSGEMDSLEVPAQQINTLNPAWVPIICWVDGSCKNVLSVDVDATDPATLTPLIWVAGVPAETITFNWEIWQQGEWTSATGADMVVSSSSIIPDDIPVGLPTINLPALTLGGQDRWQLVLHATRQFEAYPGATAIALKSNPILITLYRGSTP